MNVMELYEQEIAAADLQVGMYVCRLDRPWEGTPFPLQGISIESRADVELVRMHAERVYIDLEKSTETARLRLRTLSPPRRAPARAQAELKAVTVTEKHSVAARSFEDEVASSFNLLEQLSERTQGLLQKIGNGETVSREEVDQVVEPVVRSLSRNPDAYFWLESLRSRHHYTYTHAVNCCALAAVFARHLGLDDDTVKSMATGALLLDIGMGAVPPDMINHVGPLDEVSRAFVERHVTEGVERLRQSGVDDPDLLDMVLNHHEHSDGSGYPAGKTEDLIPLSGRIAALIDSFDAMTSHRPYRVAISRAEALQELVKERHGRHDADLVEQFVRCLGVYPVGTLVELNTGEVGLVMTQNAEHRLRPRLMMLTNPAKQLRMHFIPVDLADTAANPALAEVRILRSLPPGAYGLDPTALPI